MTVMSRRCALALLAAMPMASVVLGQTPGPLRYRVTLNKLHGLLLAPDGTVRAWYTGLHGGPTASDALGLGHNDPLAAFTLGSVKGLTDVVAVAAGSACSFAVRADGRLMAWGLNAGDGMLGTTLRSAVEVSASWGPNSNLPVPVPIDFHAVAVSSYASHVLALARDGSVYAWGKSDKGRLGIGPLPVINFKTRTPATMPFVPFPTRLPDLAGVTAVSAGSTHSLARLEDGTVRAWGENRWGQLGDGTTVTRDRPVVVSGVRNAVAVAAGGSGFSVALLADGTVMTWGNNTLVALGRPVPGNATVVPVPALVPGVRDVRAIAVGEGHVLALHHNGTVASWGDDTLGTLGRGKDKTLTPGLVPGLTNVHEIVAFETSSAAVLANGRIMNWGVVRPWTRPPDEGGRGDISRSPILFWRDGFEQP